MFDTAFAPVQERVYYLSKIALLLVGTVCSQQAFAEWPVDRTGAFAKPGPPTPSCDDFGDQLNSVADAVADGAIYLGEWTGRTVEATGRLVTGDPDAFIEQINRTWRDTKTATRYMVENGGGAGILLGPLIKEVMPNGALEDFLSDATNKSLGVWADTVESGLNTVENDIAEISHDMWDIVENIDDPAAFANSFANKMQKWNPAASLSYVFTEDDPITGLKKAAGAISRQVDIVSTYIMPYAKGAKVAANARNKSILAKIEHAVKKKIAKNAGIGTSGIVKNMTKASIKAAVKEMVTEGILEQMMEKGRSTLLVNGTMTNKNAQAATAALMAGIAAQVRASNHPFYRMQVTNVPAKWMKDNYKDGGDREWGVWHPEVETGNNCISLGDYIKPYRGGSNPQTKALCGDHLRAGFNQWWTRPIDYKLVWGDNCSGGRHDRSIWTPVCPTGFISTGFVGWYGSWEKPLPNRIACLANQPDLIQMKDGQTAGLQWKTDDKGSGGKYDVSIYSRTFAGIEVMFAVPFYPRNKVQTAKEIQVPVSWGVPSSVGLDTRHTQQWADVNTRSSKPSGKIKGGAQTVSSGNVSPTEVYTHQIALSGSNRIMYMTSNYSAHEWIEGVGMVIMGIGYAVPNNPGWTGFIRFNGMQNGYSIDDKGGLWSSSDDGRYIEAQVAQLIAITPRQLSQGFPQQHGGYYNPALQSDAQQNQEQYYDPQGHGQEEYADDQGQEQYYDEQGQEQNYDEQGQDQYYDEQGQEQYYDEQGQDQYYDEQGQEQYYDEQGQDQYYDEQGQDQYYDEQGQDQYYDEQDQGQYYDQ